MDNYLPGILLGILIACCILLISKFIRNKKLSEKQVLTAQNENLLTDNKVLEQTKEKLIESLKQLVQEKEKNIEEISATQKQLANLKSEYSQLNNETKELQELKAIADEIKIYAKDKDQKLAQLHELEAKIDLYSRLDDYIGYGFYDTPDYLYETSERFAIEIKAVRDKQKTMIKDDIVISYSTNNLKNSLIENSLLEKIIQLQKKLVIRTFNIECDFLIEKVNPSNFERTLNRITSLASELEKLFFDMRFGFSTTYIQLKLEECKLQFQFRLKKKEEQEEQKLIKEQMREEEKARREYEAQMAQAEKEEKLYQNLLERARTELEKASNEERQQALLKIQTLEQELAEAKEKSERAKSMAEQTKRGHVYIISNIGSFGENIYKIGMTRRLDPMDRVKELGDASVPFSFDVHAMIYSEDAPKLENELHKTFHHNRVNAINLKKEFFHVSLEKIKEETERLTNNTAEFTMTILADEYYQTQRLRYNS